MRSYTPQKQTQELWGAILAEFARQEPPMTVRQMFYRMSATGNVPKTENGYRKVQYALLHMRRNGVIPYSHIADGTRWVRAPRTYAGLPDALQARPTILPARHVGQSSRLRRILD